MMSGLLISGSSLEFKVAVLVAAPASTTIQATWLKTVLPCVLDQQASAVDSCCAMTFDVLLAPLVATASATNELAWSLLERIRGQYEASLLTLGSVKVLRMDEPGLTEERRLTGWDLQLDYRVSDVHSREYDFRLSPESQRLNTTKGKLCMLCGVICKSHGVLRRNSTESFEANIPTGKQLIDAIFSHQALSYEDGRDLSYMRQVAGKTCV